MLGFIGKNFGRGGNTLVVLIVFFGLGILLHFKDRFFASGKIQETLETLVTDALSEQLTRISDSPTASVVPITLEDGATLEEIIGRPDFVYPVYNGKDKLQLVTHKAFSLGYYERYEQSAWVAYPLSREQVVGQGSRERFFNPDPKVRTGSALFSDYTGSGYDRGHLAAAADFKNSQEHMKETFYMSNISPQNREFNAGIWNDLEKLVRAWANHYEKIYVVTGPVLKPGLPTIGKVNKVAVPEQFYKVILYAKPPYVKGIAFLMKNQPSTEPLSKAVVSIDEVEKLTGLDFFPLLPKDIADKVESASNPRDWYRLK